MKYDDRGNIETNHLRDIIQEIDRILCIQGFYDYTESKVIQEIGKQIETAKEIIKEK